MLPLRFFAWNTVPKTPHVQNVGWSFFMTGSSKILANPPVKIDADPPMGQPSSTHLDEQVGWNSQVVPPQMTLWHLIRSPVGDISSCIQLQGYFLSGLSLKAVAGLWKEHPLTPSECWNSVCLENSPYSQKLTFQFRKLMLCNVFRI